MGGHRQVVDVRERLESRVRLFTVVCLGSVGLNLAQTALLAVWWVTR